MILDLFAGPGGWDQGLSELGYTDVLGIDFDPSACKTAELAGHKRIVADIANISFSDTGLFSIDGLIASPPCQGLSSGGRKNGWQDREKLIDAILNDNAHEYKDDKSVFLLEPKRWIQESDPKWIVLENVYAVLPVYQAYKEWLEKLGFFVTVNDLQTEAFGVPQTRRRIILVATKDRSVYPLAEYNRFGKDDGLLPTPNMSQWIYDSPDNPFELDKANDYWLFNSVRGTSTTRPRHSLQPAMTMAFGENYGSFRFEKTWEGRTDYAKLPDRFQLTDRDAGMLQTFPFDYPWQGNKSSRFRQIGNAVPPLLSQKILKDLIC